MKNGIDVDLSTVTARDEGIEAFFDMIGVAECPYEEGSRYKAFWLAGWLEGFSGKRIDVQMAQINAPACFRPSLPRPG
jgi:hypothetical protein